MCIGDSISIRIGGFGQRLCKTWTSRTNPTKMVIKTSILLEDLFFILIDPSFSESPR
jgi:hypothetical protein